MTAYPLSLTWTILLSDSKCWLWMTARSIHPLWKRWSDVTLLDLWLTSRTRVLRTLATARLEKPSGRSWPSSIATVWLMPAGSVIWSRFSLGKGRSCGWAHRWVLHRFPA